MSKALMAWMDHDPSRSAGGSDELARVACLLEAGLTVTIHAKECLTEKDD